MKKNILLVIIISLLFFNATGKKVSAQPDRISHGNQELFLSGINLAWINFANDLGNFNEAEFTRAMDEVSEAGGNSVRWWLHTNGRNSPQFSNGKVSGIDPAEISNLRKALDIAYERGIVLDLCLWSFDMLQPNAGTENLARNRKLLEDTSYTMAYVRNALIPMVSALKGHPGILCWEVFNEPEGMTSKYGWTPEKVDISYVQQFVNIVAGAIHRTDPSAKVSNGSWNIKVLTDVDGFYNFYRDDRLVAAGGDKDGTLDFYMVHYYPQHFGVSQSPFHHPASYWKLNKPLVIAEFPALGISLGDNSLTTMQAYQYAFDNGYAGAMSWTWTGHDGNGGLPECKASLMYLSENHPDAIVIDEEK